MIQKLLKLFGYKSGSVITPQLLLTDSNAAVNVDFLKEHRVTTVVNCSKNIPYAKTSLKFRYRIPLDDDCVVGTICQMTLYLKDLIPKLNHLLNQNEIILIHCQCGMQRSASVLSALLMYRYKITFLEAYRIIKNKRYIAFLPFPNFQLSLDMYEQYLRQIGHIETSQVPV